MRIDAEACDIDCQHDVGRTVLALVLKTLGKDEGFVERSEVTGADGKSVLELSPDVVEQAEALGLSLQDVLREFEKLVRMQAQRMGEG